MDKVKHQSVSSGFSFFKAQEFEFVCPRSLHDCEKRVQRLNGQPLPNHGSKLNVSLVPVSNMNRTKIHMQVTTWTRFETELQAMMIPVDENHTEIVGKTRVTESTFTNILYYGAFLIIFPLFFAGSFTSDYFSPMGFWFLLLIIMLSVGGGSLFYALMSRRSLISFLEEELQ